MQLVNNILLVIFEESSSSFLRRVNGFCRMSRLAFLKRGSYLSHFLWTDDYFLYLLKEGKYDLFIRFMDEGHLRINKGLCTSQHQETTRIELLVTWIALVWRVTYREGK